MLEKLDGEFWGLNFWGTGLSMRDVILWDRVRKLLRDKAGDPVKRPGAQVKRPNKKAP